MGTERRLKMKLRFHSNVWLKLWNNRTVTEEFFGENLELYAMVKFQDERGSVESACFARIFIFGVGTMREMGRSSSWEIKNERVPVKAILCTSRLLL